MQVRGWARGASLMLALQFAVAENAVALTPAENTAALHELFADSDEAALALSPVSAMVRGDMRFADQFGDCVTPGYYARLEADTKSEMKRLEAIDRSLLSHDDQVGLGRLQRRGEPHPAGAALRPGRFWTMARGRAIRKETKGYVPKLMAAAIVTKHQEAFGFKPEEVTPGQWTEYEEVTVPNATDLSALGRALGVAERDLLELNPELRRSCTPPRPYALKVPTGRAEAFSQAWPALESSARLAFANHRVQRGESLTATAAGYGVPAGEIARMNGLRPGRRLQVGTDLVSR